jgi:hypothetical protein
VNGTRGLGHAPRKRAANHSPRSNSASWQSRSRASNFGLPHIFPVGRFDRVGPGGRCEEYRPAADPRASFDSSPPSPCSVTRPQLIVGPAARFAVDLTNGLRPYGPSARDSPSATPSSPGAVGVCSGLASAAQRGETDLGSLLPDRWAASHPEHVWQHRLDESRPRVARQKAVRERRRAKARRRREGHRRKRRCRLMSRIERLAAARSRIGGRPLGVATRGRRYGLRGRCAHRRLKFCLTLVVSRSDWR